MDRINEDIKVEERNGRKLYMHLYHCPYCGSDVWRTQVSEDYKSCGCMLGEWTAKRMKGNCIALKHNESHKTKEWAIWTMLKGHCYNKNNYSYGSHGKKGIKLCDAWLDYMTFKQWMISHNYKKGDIVYRVNPNKDYEPDNCILISRSDIMKKMHREKTL